MTVNYHTRPTAELSHLTWCALVAIRLAQQEGKAQSPLQQHLYIMQWLTTAQKRRLLPKNVAPDIIWLLNQGKKYGFAANLLGKIDYIYRSSAGELAAQSALFRFTYFVETLKTMGWLDFLVPPKDWESNWKCSERARAVYTPKAQLHPSFDEAGALIKPLPVRFTGDISGVYTLMEQCNLRFHQETDHEGFSAFVL
ncbi:DUF2913 family protein [Rahnella sp. BCC 1045]|uniref:DUF2913 family protein n=1 Tax=Rahnella sp. BCC 1045 TaxID=2816251 RepID=UPI001C263FF6|nr:DUF2913 family protein [Rahnella sp. BCC 1045]MBU9818620.1 DUF2913 family protein [Rahnella sp. BCC 1045]